MQKRTEGFYILLQFTAKPETVRELERQLRVQDQVMKFITVRIDEKLKKIAKRKKSRRETGAEVVVRVLEGYKNMWNSDIHKDDMAVILADLNDKLNKWKSEGL